MILFRLEFAYAFIDWIRSINSAAGSTVAHKEEFDERTTNTQESRNASAGYLADHRRASRVHLIRILGHAHTDLDDRCRRIASAGAIKQLVISSSGFPWHLRSRQGKCAARNLVTEMTRLFAEFTLSAVNVLEVTTS